MDPLYVLVPALVAIIVVRRINPLVAGLMGVTLSLGIGAWGIAYLVED